MSRTSGQVFDELLALLPTGWSVPAGHGTYGAALYGPMAGEWAAIEASAEAMLPEIDPRQAFHLLPDYERVLGPDPCGRDGLGLSDPDRRAVAFQRWTQAGHVCAGYFVAAAAAIGVTLTVTEYRPAHLGTFELGGCGLANSLDYCGFTVSLPASRVRYFELGASSLPELLGAFTPNLMECVVRLLAPLHAPPSFSYTG